MDEIKNNKKTIIICIILIIVIPIIYLLLNLFNKNKNNNTYYAKDINKYDSNQYMYIVVDEDDVVKIYLNEFINQILYSKEDAYNSLNQEYRDKRFGSYENFAKYLDDYITNSTYSTVIDRYSKNQINGKKVFNIYDKTGNQYIIKENSIMNYEVYLDEYTVIIK